VNVIPGLFLFVFEWHLKKELLKSKIDEVEIRVCFDVWGHWREGLRAIIGAS